MAKKGRRRERIRAPEFEYRDEHGSVLVLRGSMTPATRLQYAEVAGGNILSREDAWQRAVEFLFERLAVRWEIAGTEPLTRQKELLGALPLRLRRTSGAGSATCCASTWPSTSRSCRRRERRRASRGC